MIVVPGYIASGDITSVVAGVSLSGGATSGDATLTLDLSELSDVTPVNGDKLATLDSDGAQEQLTTIASLATLFAGDGLTASSAVLAVNVDDSTIETSSDAIRIKDNGVSLAKMAGLTRGSIIYGDTSGDPAALAKGNADQVLTSDGTDIAWADAASGVSLSGSTDNTVATVTGSNALAGEANLTFDGSTLAVTGAVTISTDLTVSGGDIVYGNGQNATASVAATAHNAAGKNLTITAGPTTAGTTNNIAGGALTFQGGQGKGSGAGGDIVFQTANAAGSGSSLNSLATALTISDDLSSTFSGPVTVGVDDTGHDVTFFGASAGAYMLYDQSEDQLVVMGASADATTSTGKLLLATSLNNVNANDVIGKVEFQAPSESGGTDAITVAASIEAVAQGTFAADLNSTDLIFKTGHSEAAAEKFRFTSQGEIGIGGTNYGTDGQVLTSGGAGAAPAWEDAGGGGLEEYDIFSLSSNASSEDNDPLDTNLVRWAPANSAFQHIGTGMSISSGIFTFPSTGKWEISAQAWFDTGSSTSQGNYVYIYHTHNATSGSVNWEVLVQNNSSGGDPMTPVTGSILVDITDTGEQKVKMRTLGNGTLFGSGQVFRTGMVFKKVGAT